MKSIEHIFLLGVSKERRSVRIMVDTVLGATGALLGTFCIYYGQLYPKIPNISILYLLLVLALASTRGLYSAIITSIVAFLSFDYLLVSPRYTFSIAALEEWLALFIFLVTAMITGQLASALGQHAQQATERENETRVLYELVNATTNEEDLSKQLAIIVRSIVQVFAAVGVRDCAILLADANGKLLLMANACLPVAQVGLSPDEEVIAASAMSQRQIFDVYDEAAAHDIHRPFWFRRVIAATQASRRYVRIVPLQSGQRSVGVVRLLMEGHAWPLSIERRGRAGHEDPHTETAFFWTFLDQATSVIEHARLRRESMQMELLQRTDALRSALLSSVSHDLRTPLASIKAAASSLLQDDVHWDEETKHSFVLAIENEADRLNRLVSNLLDMSRIEGGALKPEKEWYPLDELVHDVLGHMQFLLQGREIVTVLPDDLPPVELDYLQIDQVLTNLLENAACYTPATSPIEIAVEVADDNMLVSIADCGPGIPEDDLERIFDKFYRVSGTAREGLKLPGSGLGLAVCRGIIEAHGGRVWAESCAESRAESRKEGGAIFRFTLPLRQMEEQLYG